MKGKTFIGKFIVLVTIALFTLNAATAPTNAQSSDESSPTNQTRPVSQSLKKSVEMLGGQLWVESEVGQGSMFFIKLAKE